ncbi:MAG: hypothetical protein ACKVS9_11170, partial [Phycisphaerae bacterium]
MSTSSVFADTFTPVASYEPSEVGLTLTRGGADATLTITRVQGGVSGAPAATDGTHVLRLQYTNEPDRKIEYRHDWTSSTYDLGGNVELLADVYFTNNASRPTVVGVFSPNWQPPDAWEPAVSVPTQTGQWRTVAMNVSDRSQSDLNYIAAFVFENLGGSAGTIYVDNLRLRSP